MVFVDDNSDEEKAAEWVTPRGPFAVNIQPVDFLA